jgi:hypothetical protein
VTAPSPPVAERRRLRFRLWHLLLIVLFVAVAAANIRDQRMTEPALVALAAAGFVLYALLGWLGWRLAERYRRPDDAPGADRRNLVVLILYLAMMSALFLAATGIYLVIEYRYRNG